MPIKLIFEPYIEVRLMSFEITERGEYRQFNMIQGDTLPPIRIKVLDNIQDALDLTGHTVDFHFRKIDDLSTLLNSGHTSCTITDALNGMAQYDWTSGDTDLTGIHYGEFILTDPNGRRQSYPNYLRFDIRQRLDSVSGIYY
jgi:hypothetical protein